MSEVYIVMSLNNSQLAWCEVYDSLTPALNKAKEIVGEMNENSDLLVVRNPNPTEHKMPDGSTKWCLLNVHAKSVFVINKQVTSCNSSTTDPAKESSLDDPYHSALPAGWDYNNKPITMEYLLKFPYDVKPYSTLTEAQKWALSKARIAKRPHYTFVPNNVGKVYQLSALKEINNKSYLGELISSNEINVLEAYVDHLINELDGDSESEDSSYQANDY